MGLFDKLKTVFKKEDKSVNTYEKGLSKTRKSFVNKLANLSKEYSEINDNYFEELEELLINADIGVNTVMDFMDKLQVRVSKEKITDPSMLTEIIVDELFIIYVNDDILSNKINYNEEGPTVILFVGVNGVGKTTTIAKLASKFKKEGKKVLLAAGDTFRAAAEEQLDIWAKRADVDIVRRDRADSASVVYEALKKAQTENYNVLIIDTAGRLQNKFNLIDELKKVKSVISKNAPEAVVENILVLDANLGQNGLSQAKVFGEAVDITSVALTKLDGSAKGGIVLAVAHDYKLPTKLIGIGEKIDDLKDFDSKDFIEALF